MISKYLKNAVLGRIFGQKRGIVMGVRSKTVEFHYVSGAANVTVTK